MPFEERKQMKDAALAAAKAREETLSTHPAINNFLREGYNLKIWDDRYSTGITIALGVNYSQSFVEVCELTGSSDIEAEGFREYLLNSGAWLPFESGPTLQCAIDALEEKLEKIPPNQISRTSHWATAYDEAISKLLKHADGGYGISNAIDASILPPDPLA